MHYSRISVSPHKSYSAASAVFLNELIKGAVSVVIALSRIDADMLASAQSRVYAEKDSQNTERRPSYSWRSPFHSSRLRSLTKSVFSPDCYKLSVPAILYVIQNNLQYVAASNLDVATFQVTYQMKILTTAFFSVLLLRRRLSKMKWASLVMLAVGVAIVQLQSTTAPATQLSKKTVKMGTTNSAATGESLIAPDRVMRPFHGFLAVTLACMTSGLAGVYFEFILKASSGSTPPPDLWIRNTQLSLFSLVPALIPILFAPSGPEGAGLLGRIMTSFSNFNGWALGTVLTQTLGGLITAIVIRYSDNIMFVLQFHRLLAVSLCRYRKGFATSLSIIISFLASVALFSYPITLAFIVGSSIVLASTYLYNAPASPSTPPTRVDVGVSPGSPIPLTAPILGEPDRPSRASSVINLFGLGSSSGSSSRQPSFHDLRGQAQSQLSFTHMNTPHHAHGFYSASAPGSPYLSSGHPIMTSMYDNSKASTSPDMNIPPSRTRSPGLRMSGSDGSGCDRPVLSVETGEKQRLMD